MAHVNKRVLNPREIKKGKRPVLTHTGRVSGAQFQTPMDAHAVENGYLFFVMYTSRSDWVRNVLHSKTALLTVGPEVLALANPRLVSSEEAGSLLPDTDMTPGRVKGIEYLRMDMVLESGT